MVTTVKNSSLQHTTTYASVLSRAPKKQECVQLIVKPNDSFKGDTLEIIQKQVATKTNAKVLKMSKVENGTVFIKCSSAQDSEAIVQTLNSESNNILTAKACEKNNPQIRITNILSDVGKEELADDIINRNQLPPNSVIITYTYKQKNDNHSALAQVTCDTYDKIMKTEHVFVGYQN